MEIIPQPIPLHTDADRVVRVGSTRVSLDVIVAAFEQGATAEEIAQQYPSVQLADIYAAISYYLHNKNEVEAYLHQRRVHASRVREQNEARFEMRGIRDRLLARRAAIKHEAK